MKDYKYIWLIVIIAVLLSAVWLFQQPNKLVSNKTSVVSVTNSIVSVPSAPPTNLASTTKITLIPAPTNTSNPGLLVSPGLYVSTNLAAEYQAYKQGKISKGALITAALLSQNNKPQDFYGQVIDQYGGPVVGAKVTGWVTFLQGMDSDEKREAHKTETDAEGLFQFTGLRGASISADVAKEGYEIDYRVGYQVPAEKKTSPDNRAILTMWKLKGPEPMTHANIHAYIPCDGSVMRFDLLTGKKNPNGDLIVKLTRNPVEIVRGKHFDWSITLGIGNGGLQQITDLYPNEAPTDGYQSEMTFDFPADMPNWDSFWSHSFYFQSRGGQIYGRIGVSIQADFEPPPTLFDVDVYANPSGSRNLEFDRAKQIQ